MQEPGQRLRAAADGLTDDLLRYDVRLLAVLPHHVVQAVPQAPAVQVVAAAASDTTRYNSHGMRVLCVHIIINLLHTYMYIDI